MAVTAYWYVNALVNLVTRAQNIDWDTNTIRVMLTTSSYTPNQDTHVDLADGARTNEVSGTGYTADGEALGTKTNATSLNVLTLDAADTQWTTATFTARRAVIFDDASGVDATSPLISWVDFGQDESVTAGTFTIQWNASGIATATATDATGFP